MNKTKIFILDEWKEYTDWATQVLLKEDFVLQRTEADELLSQVARENVDVILLHWGSRPGEEQLSLVKELKDIDDKIPILVTVKEADVVTAVRFMKEEVYDFLIASYDESSLKQSIEAANQHHLLTKRIYQIETSPKGRGDFFGIVGQSTPMLELFKMIETVAKSKATVLILGQSGVGKELVACAIHSLSKRLMGKFIDINCGAIPGELLENELFGHERGAYTGANRRYIGSVERAEGGTLFLDEICEMDLDLQVKILRVLQEKQFYRVGGNERVDVDVRVLAATNRNIEEEVREGRFREDLYYRLNVIPLFVPPLRERVSDIPLLAKYFLNQYTLEGEKILLDIKPEAMELLMEYDWPGNVRELENAIQRMVALTQDSVVKVKHLPEEIKMFKKKGKVASHNYKATTEISPLDDVEKQAIVYALKNLNGNMTLVAKRLQIGQATLYRKIRKYGIER